MTITTTWTDGNGPHTITTTKREDESVSEWELRHLAAVIAEMGA